MKVHSYAYLDGAVVQPYVDIGRSARLSNVVIDRGVCIPQGLVVGEDAALDAKNRAKMVQEVLKAAGVSEDRLVLQKPMLMDAGNERDARRVEVTAQ